MIKYMKKKDVRLNRTDLRSYHYVEREEKREGETKREREREERESEERGEKR